MAYVTCPQCNHEFVPKKTIQRKKERKKPVRKKKPSNLPDEEWPAFIRDKQCILKPCEQFPNDPCWIWQGNGDTSGYGLLWSPRHRQCIRAHRVTYELVHGPINEKLGFEFSHLCHRPSCCNPNHVKYTTHLENMEDGVDRTARIPRETIQEVHRRLKEGERNWQIAEELGLNKNTVHNIKHGKSKRYRKEAS